MRRAVIWALIVSATLLGVGSILTTWVTLAELLDATPAPPVQER